MPQLSKKVVSLVLLSAAVGGLILAQGDEVQAFREAGVACTMDVVVESLSQTGTVVSREVYTKDFVLLEGGRIDEDFSTRTRFKFFSASLQKANGELTIDANWFADVTVFNSVDLTTSVVLMDGQKTGKSVGSTTVYTSNGATTTTFSLTCTEN